MIYREYLVMRKALLWFAVSLLAIVVIGVGSRTLVITGAPADVSAKIYVAAGYFAALFAAIFGVALGNGSREPARVLWVLPVARWKLALQIVAVDLAGTTVAFACAYAIVALLLVLSDPRRGIDVLGTERPGTLAMGLALAYATYGWSALAGMIGRRVPYCGFVAAPLLLVWYALSESPAAIGAVLRTAVTANPFVVFDTSLALQDHVRDHAVLESTAASLLWLGTSGETPVLLAIAAGTCGVAVALWQRAEAIA